MTADRCRYCACHAKRVAGPWCPAHAALIAAAKGTLDAEPPEVDR